MEKEITERQARVLIELAISVVLLGFSIWAIYYEFGWSIFNQPVLLLIFVYLGFLGYVLFRFRWAEATKKSTDEKLDDLIVEIKEIKKLLKGNKPRKRSKNDKQ